MMNDRGGRRGVPPPTLSSPLSLHSRGKAAEKPTTLFRDFVRLIVEKVTLTLVQFLQIGIVKSF